MLHGRSKLQSFLKEAASVREMREIFFQHHLSEAHHHHTVPSRAFTHGVGPGSNKTSAELAVDLIGPNWDERLARLKCRHAP